MSFSREAKDFINAYKGMSDTVNKNKLTAAQIKYYNGVAKYYGANGSTTDPANAARIKGAAEASGDSSMGGVQWNGYRSDGSDMTGADYNDRDDPAAQAIPTDGNDAGNNYSGLNPQQQAAAAPDIEAPAYGQNQGEQRIYAATGGAIPDAQDDDSVSQDQQSDVDPEQETYQTALRMPGVRRPYIGRRPAAGSDEGIPLDDTSGAPDQQPSKPQDTEDESPTGRDDLLGMALHGGTMFLSKLFGLQNATKPQVDGAVDNTPTHPGGRYLMNGVGAATPEEYDAVMKKIDPSGKLDDSIRNIAGLKAVYDFYLQRGDIDKADKSAASLIQYARGVSAQYGAAALKAIQNGDFEKGTKLLQKGYDQIPDGNTVEVVKLGPDGHGFMIQKDQDGNIVGQGPFTPQYLLSAATGMRDGSLFWKQLTTAAHKYLGNTGEPSKAYEGFLYRIYGIKPDGTPADDDSGQGTVTPPGNASGAPGAPGAQGATPASAEGPSASSDDNVMGVQPASTQQASAVPPPQYIKLDPKELAQMDPKERASAIQQVAAQNKQIRQNWLDQQKQAKGAGKMGGIKPENRDKIVGQLDSAWDEYAAENPEKDPNLVKLAKTNPAEVRTTKDAAFDLFSRNENMTPSQAIFAARSLVTVDPKNPQALNFKAVALPDGSGARIQLRDGTVINIGRNALSELAALRGQKIAAAKKALEDSQNTVVNNQDMIAKKKLYQEQSTIQHRFSDQRARGRLSGRDYNDLDDPAAQGLR